MAGSAGKTAGLVALFLLAYAGTAALLFLILPGPHQQLDYLVIGAVATAVSLILLFLVLLGPRFRKSESFYRKRTK